MHVNEHDEREAIYHVQDYFQHCYKNNYILLCDEAFGTRTDHLNEFFFQQHPTFYQILKVVDKPRQYSKLSLQFLVAMPEH